VQNAERGEKKTGRRPSDGVERRQGFGDPAAGQLQDGAEPRVDDQREQPRIAVDADELRGPLEIASDRVRLTSASRARPASGEASTSSRVNGGTSPEMSPTIGGIQGRTGGPWPVGYPVARCH